MTLGGWFKPRDAKRRGSIADDDWAQGAVGFLGKLGRLFRFENWVLAWVGKCIL